MVGRKFGVRVKIAPAAEQPADLSARVVLYSGPKHVARCARTRSASGRDGVGFVRRAGGETDAYRPTHAQRRPHHRPRHYPGTPGPCKRELRAPRSDLREIRL